MAKTPTNIPVTTETKGPVPAGQAPWYPLATLREEMDRLFDDFFTGWPMNRESDDGPQLLAHGASCPSLGRPITLSQGCSARLLRSVNAGRTPLRNRNRAGVPPWNEQENAEFPGEIGPERDFCSRGDGGGVRL